MQMNNIKLVFLLPLVTGLLKVFLEKKKSLVDDKNNTHINTHQQWNTMTQNRVIVETCCNKETLKETSRRFLDCLISKYIN